MQHYSLLYVFQSKINNSIPISLIFAIECDGENFGPGPETKLINNIMNERGYNQYARPVRNESEAVEVKFGLSLQQIVDVVS